MRDYASQREIPTRHVIITTNTLDKVFMKKTKLNGNAVPQTLKRKKTLNDDLPEELN